MNRELRFKRTPRKHSNKRNIAIIGFGFVIVLFMGGYLYVSSLNSGKEGVTKSLILSVLNKSKEANPAKISVKINGKEVFSDTVAEEASSGIKIKLNEGQNKVELFTNGRLIKEGSFSIGPPTNYNFFIHYSDSAGQPQFSYKAEEFFYQ